MEPGIADLRNVDLDGSFHYRGMDVSRCTAWLQWLPGLLWL